jgi:hypothetical protein
MPRTSTLDKQAVAKYCTEPRSINDICWKFGISISPAHRAMASLCKSGHVVSRLTKGSGARHKVFLLSNLENAHAWGGDAPFMNPLMAHDPFGRTKELALQLQEQGVSVEDFSRKYTRSIRVLDIDPHKVLKQKRKVWGKK